MKRIAVALLTMLLYPAVASAGHHSASGFFFAVGFVGGTYCSHPVCNEPCYTGGAGCVSPGWARTYQCAPHYCTGAPVYCRPCAVYAPPGVVYQSPAVVYPRVYYPTPYTGFADRSFYYNGCYQGACNYRY